jgi:hypothetical protein
MTDTPPHYQQMPLATAADGFTAIASPTGEGCLRIQQSAFVYWASLSAGNSLDYTKILPNNAIYVLVIDGDMSIDDVVLAKRDALGDFTATRMRLQSEFGATALLFEVPVS